jgi:hypothetical protein
MRGEPEPDAGVSDEADPPADAANPPTKGRPPKSLTDAAKALGLDPEALYELEVPLKGKGKEQVVKKLGELKDYFAEQDSHRLDRLDWEESRSREQGAIARERAELLELMSAIPPDKLNTEVLNKVRNKMDAHVKQERRRTLEAIPEWEDESSRTTDLAGIAEHLADYGFPASALQGITDHRMIRYMRDNWLRKSRLQAALDKVRPVRTGSPARSKAAGTAPTPVRSRESQGTRNLENQVSAVSKLLRG